MVSLEQMALGYTEQLRYRVQEAEEQLNRLKQHLEECETEVQFASPSPILDIPKQPEQASCESGNSEEGCCSPDEVSTIPLTLNKE
jgi:hypothetical protein